MATDTQQVPAHLGITTRVLGIPIVSSSIDTIHGTLSSSPYTKGAYQTGQNLAVSAYGTAARISSPVYPTIQPVINVADGYASKAFDAVHARVPYPFEASPQTIYDDIKKAPEGARDVAYQTIDQRIKQPAYGLAMGVDHSLAPLVNLLDAILIKLHAKPQPSSVETQDSPVASTSSAVSDKAQVTRAKEIVLDAKDHIFTLTTEQAKALKAQNVYIQRASEHVDALNSTVTAHYQNVQTGINVYKEKGIETYESYKGGVVNQYQNAQATIANYKGKGPEFGKETRARIYALSSCMVAELEKIQSTTAALPAQIQATLKPLTDAIGDTVVEMKGILLSNEPGVGIGEKASRLGTVVKERTGPIVEQGVVVYAAALDKFVHKAQQTTEQPPEPPRVNGVYGQQVYE